MSWGLMLGVGLHCTERSSDAPQPVESPKVVSEGGQGNSASDMEYYTGLRKYIPESLKPSACESLKPLPQGISTRMVKGELDVRNRYGAAVVMVTGLDGEERRCGGVVVGRQRVLTAAQCVCRRRDVTGEEGQKQIVLDASDCARSATVSAIHYAPRKPGHLPGHEGIQWGGDIRVHPGFRLILDGAGEILTSEADLAMLRLDAAVEERHLPVAFARTEVAPGEALVMTTYGNATRCEGWEAHRFFQRTRVGRLLPGGRFSFEQPYRELRRWQSGGPCLREKGQALEVVGISGQNLGAEPTCVSTHAYQQWIQEQIREE